jgi:hypothetical protein
MLERRDFGHGAYHAVTGRSCGLRNRSDRGCYLLPRTDDSAGLNPDQLTSRRRNNFGAVLCGGRLSFRSGGRIRSDLAPRKWRMAQPRCRATCIAESIHDACAAWRSRQELARSKDCRTALLVRNLRARFGVRCKNAPQPPNPCCRDCNSSSVGSKRCAAVVVYASSKGWLLVVLPPREGRVQLLCGTQHR